MNESDSALQRDMDTMVASHDFSALCKMLGADGEISMRTTDTQLDVSGADIILGIGDKEFLVQDKSRLERKNKDLGIETNRMFLWSSTPFGDYNLVCGGGRDLIRLPKNFVEAIDSNLGYKIAKYSTKTVSELILLRRIGCDPIFVWSNLVKQLSFDIMNRFYANLTEFLPKIGSAIRYNNVTFTDELLCKDGLDVKCLRDSDVKTILYKEEVKKSRPMLKTILYMNIEKTFKVGSEYVTCPRI